MSFTKDPLIGAILAERYRVVAQIGRGGAGTVYRGIQLQLEREVAIKVVRSDVPEKSREEFEARFFREASLAGRLSHPNVVTTHDYGVTDDGQQFVVMELLRGRTLKRALKGGALDANLVAEFGAGVARGLEHAHKRGLVHRDVKSSNVFLVKNDDGGERPLLLDFGLVKSVKKEQDITQTPTYLGTPLYMSPEQARGEMNIDARSDVYSLGCMLYCMCCGEMPYRGETPMATALMHLTDPYPSMKSKVPEIRVDKTLEAIVARCLKKLPAHRYQSAADVAQALEAWGASDESMVSAAVGKRTTVVMGAVGVMGLLALLGGGVALLLGGVAVAWSMWAFGSSGAVDPVVVVDVADAPDVIAAVAPPVAGVEPVEVERVIVVDTDLDVIEVVPVRTSSGSKGAKTSSTQVASSAKQTSTGRASGGPDVVAPRTERVVRSSSSFKAVLVDDYTFESLTHIKRAVRFVNNATDEELALAGVHELVRPDVLANRPYKSIQAFAYTRGIGPATMRAVGNQTLTSAD